MSKRMIAGIMLVVMITGVLSGILCLRADYKKSQDEYTEYSEAIEKANELKEVEAREALYDDIQKTGNSRPKTIVKTINKIIYKDNPDLVNQIANLTSSLDSKTKECQYYYDCYWDLYNKTKGYDQDTKYWYDLAFKYKVDKQWAEEELASAKTIISGLKNDKESLEVELAKYKELYGDLDK